MALIMLAIGGLLTLTGVYAMATGFPIIEVERGWSMVISGAVLISGGLVVAALGIVVRSINALKAGLPTAVAPSPHAEPALAPAVMPPAVMPPRAPDLSPAVVDEPRPASAVAAPAAALAAGTEFASLDDRRPHEAADPEPHHEPEVRAPLEPAPVDYAPAPPAADPRQETLVPDHADRTWHEPDFSAFDLDAPHDAPHQAAALPAPTAPEAPHAIDDHAPTPSETPAHEPVHEQSHEPAPVAAHVSEPAPAPEPAAEAPATAPDTPPGGLNVIGRYDSDGTSYVMYSDGSIEAQSESGVFRFSSMAELKAFIEG